MTPFLNLPRAVFPGEIHVLAQYVAWVEIAVSSTVAQLVIGLASGKTIESGIFQPNEKTVTTLREYRDQIMDDLIARLSVQDAKPAYAELPG